MTSHSQIFLEGSQIIQDKCKSFFFTCKNSVTFIGHLLTEFLSNLNIDMAYTICKLVLAPASLVFQPPHCTQLTAFPVRICSVEELYMDLYEPHRSDSFAILHVQALLNSVEML